MVTEQEEAQQREAELMEALAECQNMVDDLQQYSYDQGRDLAAAQTQLQVPLDGCMLASCCRLKVLCWLDPER